MKRYLVVAIIVGFVLFRQYGDKIQVPLLGGQSSSQTLVDECCQKMASDLKAFYRDGSKKLESGELKTAADAEAYASTGWVEIEKKAFKSIDEREANAVFSQDWKAEFKSLWKEFAGE